MAVTRDLDTTMLDTIEFYFLYGCNGKKMEWPRRESVLLQYSINGGIHWSLVKELHYRNDSRPRFVLLFVQCFCCVIMLPEERSI